MRKAFSAFLAAASFVTAAAWPSSAEANGRFPESNHLYFTETDPNLVVLRVTFGLLISHDRGKTWDWVCETAIGFAGVEDPMYAPTPSGRILATTFGGLTITDDVGCKWNMVGGELDRQVFIDLTSNPKDAKNVFVFASSYDKTDDAGAILFASRIWETKDEGRSFAGVGNPLDPTLLGYTIDLTASDPNRVYLTAVRAPGTTPKGVLLTSKDRGVTWAETEIALVGAERSIYIAAVDPTNANRVYLRTAGGIDKPTRLIVADMDPDGGAPQIRTTFTAEGALPGFALTKDGSKVYIGGPKDGLQVASTTDFAFEKRSSVEIGCLAIAEDGLWACSNEKSGFITGISNDDGRTFQSKLRFCEIRGPLACSEDTVVTSECAPSWPLQRETLGCGGGTRDAGPDGSAPDGGTVVDDPSPGCDCNVGHSASPWAAAIALAGGLVALLRRSRRR